MSILCFFFFFFHINSSCGRGFHQPLRLCHPLRHAVHQLYHPNREPDAFSPCAACSCCCPSRLATISLSAIKAPPKSRAFFIGCATVQCAVTGRQHAHLTRADAQPWCWTLTTSASRRTRTPSRPTTCASRRRTDSRTSALLTEWWPRTPPGAHVWERHGVDENLFTPPRSLERRQDQPNPQACQPGGRREDQGMRRALHHHTRTSTRQQAKEPEGDSADVSQYAGANLYQLNADVLKARHRPLSPELD